MGKQKSKPLIILILMTLITSVFSGMVLNLTQNVKAADTYQKTNPYSIKSMYTGIPKSVTDGSGKTFSNKDANKNALGLQGDPGCNPSLDNGQVNDIEDGVFDLSLNEILSTVGNNPIAVINGASPKGDGSGWSAQLFRIQADTRTNGPTGEHYCRVIALGGIDMKNPGPAVLFSWINSYRISYANGSDVYRIVKKGDVLYDTTNIKWSGDQRIYGLNDDGCADYLVVNTNTPQRGKWYQWFNKNNSGECEAGSAQGLSVEIDNTSVFKKSEAKDPPASETIKSTVVAGASAQSGEGAETCEGAIAVLGWIVCPIIDQASKFIQWVDEHILVGLLTINTDEYNKDQGIKTAWSAIRIISTVVLLGVALFMIIAQMLNLDVVSAYTFKKMIPRIVAGVILMQLSWYLVILLIDVFNLLGSAISDLIAAPFGGAEKLSTIASILNDYFDNTSGIAELGAYMLLGAGIVGGVGAVGGAFGLLALVISVLIAALVAFVTLVLRKVVILGLLIIAPLAIVAWLLPNTQGWWKKYWELLTKLLIMFPLIMGLIMLGRVFASIIAKAGAGGANSVVNFFLIIIAYFAPFFFIPSMIKASGTIFAQAADAIGKGGNALKGSRPIKRVEEAKKRNIEARDTNARQRGLNWATGDGGRLKKGVGRYWAGTAGAKGYAAQRLRGEEAKKMLESDNFIWSANTDQLTHGEMLKLNTQMSGKKVGDSVDLGKATGGRVNGKFTMTEGLQRLSWSDALQRKQESVIDEAASGDGRDDANFQKFIRETFPKLDTSMTDITRSKKITDPTTGKERWQTRDEFLDDVGNFSLAFSNIAEAKYTSQTDIAKAAAEGKDARTRGNFLIEQLSKNLAAGGHQREEALISINQLVHNPKFNTLDPDLISEIGKLEGGNAYQVLRGGGNVAFNPDGSLTDNRTGRGTP